MKKKLLCILMVLLCSIVCRLPKHAILRADPYLSEHALKDAHKIIHYAFAYYSNIITIDRYIRNNLKHIKKALYTYHSLKECHVKLVMHTPLFLLNDTWVIADNNHCYPAHLYDKDVLVSLTALYTTLNPPYPACKILTQLPADIVEDYIICLTPDCIIARSKHSSCLEFIAACPHNFDRDLKHFEEILAEQPYFTKAVSNNDRVTVDVRFSNQYIVRCHT